MDGNRQRRRVHGVSSMNKLFKVAQKLGNKFIPQYGVEVTFSRRTETSQDLTLGKKVGASTLTFTGSGVRTNYSDSEIDGTRVKTGDIKMLMENTETIPEIGDDAAVNGSGTFRVMNVYKTAPAEEIIVYEIQLRA